MKRIVVIISLIAMFMLGACGVAAPTRQVQIADSYSMEVPPQPAAAGAPAIALDQANSDGTRGSAAQVERLVIQTADLAIVVSDVEARMKAIEKMAQDMGGFVVSSNLYQTYAGNNSQVPEATVVIRVPAEKLEEALAQIKKDVVDVQSETRSGQDVTNQYVDLQSQLKAKEAAQAKLLEIMNGAQKTEDVLNVYQQLQAIQTDIEVLKGQIKYFEEAAALSAVSVRLIAEETVKPVEIGPWQPKGVALKAIQDLVDFSKGFAEFLIRFVLYILPTWIMIGIPLYLVFLGVRAIFRRMRRNKPKKEQPTPPPAGK
jgi:hypothetical protein